MIKIVVDQGVVASGEVASYLANRIASGGHQVSVVSLDQARGARAGESTMQANDSVISLTAEYRPLGKEKIVYWLDESSVGVQTEAPGMFIRFKHLFSGAMNIGSLRDARVFVNDTGVKSGLAAKVQKIDVLPFPLTRKVANLPGEYGRTIAVEVVGTELADEELLAVLRSVDRPGIESILMHSANRDVVDSARGLAKHLTAELKAVSEQDTFESELSTSLLYAGIGLRPDCSFQRLSLAAALLRPVVLYRSTIDDRYFVNEVTGFLTEDIDQVGHVTAMFASGVLSPEWFGESLHLYQMRRYSPDSVLMDALK